MKKLNIYLMLCVLAFLFKQGYAQTATSDSLEAYLVMAAKNNPGLKAAFSRYLASMEKIPQAGGWYDPELSMDAFLKPMELVGGNEVLDVRLMQMFPWFGTLKTAKDEASMMAKANYGLFNSAKAELYYNVKSGWYQLMKYDQEITLQLENIQILESLEQIAIIKYQSPTGDNGIQKQSATAGMTSNAQNPTMAGQTGMGQQPGPPTAGNNPSSSPPMPSGATAGMGAESPGLTDLLAIKMELLEQKNQLALLQDLKKTARARFNALLNRDQDTEIFVPDTLLLNALSIDQLALVEKILSDNPMLSMLQAESQSYQYMERKAGKMGMPMFGLGVEYVLIQKRADNPAMMNGKDMAMPMLTVTLPLYRHKYQAMKNEANLLFQASQQEIESTTNMLKTQAAQVIQNLRDATRRITLYQELVTISHETSGILLVSYAAGSSGYEEVLNNHLKWLDYKNQYIEAIIDYNTAVADAERLMNADQHE